MHQKKTLEGTEELIYDFHFSYVMLFTRSEKLKSDLWIL